MNKQIVFLVAIFVIVLSLVYFNNRRLVGSVVKTNELQVAQPTASPTSLAAGCVPTFVDGGGPYYKANAPFREVLVPSKTQGQKLIVTGKVLRSDCQTAVPGAILDIWQANESGSYEDEWYRGQITVQADGSYRFESVVPRGYGEGTGYRPPHIHFKVYENGREVITSQMFLPAARTQQIEEAYIVDLTTQAENGQNIYLATHDIILPN